MATPVMLRARGSIELVPIGAAEGRRLDWIEMDPGCDVFLQPFVPL